VLLVKQIADRYQRDCYYLLSIHSQETIEHCDVYSHSSRFRRETYICTAAPATIYSEQKKHSNIKLIHLRMHFVFFGHYLILTEDRVTD